MKLKKKPKIIIISVLLLTAIGLGALIAAKTFEKPEIKEVKVLNKIDKYNYSLKDNKTKRYKDLFAELETILKSSPVDEEKYVNKISEMFIYDFYSLKDKTAKTDIGGVDFVYSNILDNFLQNAQNTYYKYVESNIYNNRTQDLPVVDEITIVKTEQAPFDYTSGNDPKAFYVRVNWTYEGDKFSDYQKSAVLTFIHDGEKLSLVQLEK